MNTTVSPSICVSRVQDEEKERGIKREESKDDDDNEDGSSNNNADEYDPLEAEEADDYDDDGTGQTDSLANAPGSSNILFVVNCMDTFLKLSKIKVTLKYSYVKLSPLCSSDKDDEDSNGRDRRDDRRDDRKSKERSSKDKVTELTADLLLQHKIFLIVRVVFFNIFDLSVG